MSIIETDETIAALPPSIRVRLAGPRDCEALCALLDDPAHAQGTEQEILQEFRRVRDEIKVKFTTYGLAVKAGKLQG